MKELWELITTQIILYPTNFKIPDTIFHFLFTPLFINLFHAILILYIATRLASIVCTMIFDNFIGILYDIAGDISHYNNYFPEIIIGFILIDGAIGLILYYLGIYILYSILFIWPLWLFIGTLFAIKYIKWSKLSNWFKNLFIKPKSSLDLYKEELLNNN